MANKDDDDKGIFDRIGDILRSPLPGTGKDKDDDATAESKSEKSADKGADKPASSGRLGNKRPSKAPQTSRTRKAQEARRNARATENKVRKTEMDESKARGSVYGRAGARQQKDAERAKEQEQPTSAAPQPPAAPEPPPAPAPAPVPEPTPAPAPAPAAPRTYTVASGDTLGHIAQRYYGNAAQWPRIFEANRDKISNPDLIRVGQVLVIPE